MTHVVLPLVTGRVDVAQKRPRFGPLSEGEIPTVVREERPKWQRRAVIPRWKEKNGVHIYSFLTTFIVVWDLKFLID